MPAVVEGFRKTMRIEGGEQVDLRVLEPDDKTRLLRFFQGLPENERFYFKENVTSPQVVQAWVTGIDLHRVVPIVAVVDDEIVADGTLHHSRSQARQWTGEIRLVVDPRYRRKSLALGMIRALVEMARDLGLRKVSMETIEHREKPAQNIALLTGFVPVARLKEWVCDRWGNPEDMVIFELPLTDLALWERVTKTLPRLQDVEVQERA